MPTDPTSQRNCRIFLRAFAKEFDNPEQVDFIDTYDFGWWGEGHHVQYLNNNNKFRSCINWITDLCAQEFQKCFACRELWNRNRIRI